MARTANEEERALRRSQILDAAQRLVYSKGYEQMTIQDILDETGISKGAFYHYFESKGDVLEALVERTAEEVMPLLNSIIYDPQLTALQKLHRYFDTAARWKAARKDFMLALLRVWYSDDNAIVRQKIFAANLKRMLPVMTDLIHQGVREGSFTTQYPDYVSMVNINLMQGLGDTFAELLLAEGPNHGAFERCQHTVEAYNDAVERILGAPQGSICLIDAEALKEWFAPEEVVAPSDVTA